MKIKNVKYVKYKYTQKVKPMPTLIVGMYYNNMNGALLVSDSRFLRGSDYTIDQKIFEVVSGKVVFRHLVWKVYLTS
jgi:hypothetical protein